MVLIIQKISQDGFGICGAQLFPTENRKLMVSAWALALFGRGVWAPFEAIKGQALWGKGMCLILPGGNSHLRETNG